MKKIYLLLMATLGLSLPVTAAPLSPQAALQRCSQAAPGQKMATSQLFTASDLCYTLSTADQPIVYVFSRPDAGYVVVSADDVAVPVLGYSEKGSFSADNIPENMAWWLSEYQREIEDAKAHPRYIPLNAQSRPQRAPISPLVATRWNQSSPYNDLCPLVGTQRTYSGCVATAMAQIMKYHNWPEKGKGSKSYTWNNQTLSMNFSEQVFDWEHMTDIYNNQSTAQENAAVAQLMYACGISVSMNYGLSGSGAMSGVVPRAMRSNFYYGNSTCMIGREYTPLLRWEDFIYKSLQSKAPLYYSGQNLTVGHAFVCDGYSADGYFHFNWGWGGTSDGYFLLTALDPRSQGIGGSNNGYNINQAVILMALPNNINNQAFPIAESDDRLVPTYNPDSTSLTLAGRFVSRSGGACNYQLGMKITNPTTGTSKIYVGTDVTRVPLSGSLYGMRSIIDKPQDGLYIITPMYNTTPDAENPTWEEMLMPLGEPTIAYMEVKGDDVSFSFPEYELLEVKDLALETNIYSDTNFKAKFKISNPLPTEVYEFTFLCLVSGNNLVAMGDPISFDLEGGESIERTIVENFGSVSEGDYDLVLAQMVGNQLYIISDAVPVKVGTTTAANFTFSNLSVENSNAVNCNDMNISFDIKNTSGYFSYPVLMYLYEASDESSAYCGYQDVATYFIDGAETRKCTAKVSWPDLKLNTRYSFFLAANRRSSGSVYFTVATNAVNSVNAPGEWQLLPNGNQTILTAPDAITSVQVFNMAGLMQPAATTCSDNTAAINTSDLMPGIYLLRAVSKSGTRTFKLVR